VFCWKEDKVIFAESKRKSKDKIRQTQIHWLETAIKYGFNEKSFLMVEWDISEKNP
jgi:disulfide oxidoreductase YuzD